METYCMDQFLSLLVEHKWVPLAALVVGALVRLLKSDVPITPTLPPQYRALAALAFGIVSGVLEAIVGGQKTQVAIIGGLISALAAIGGNELVVEPGKRVLAVMRRSPMPPLGPTGLLMLVLVLTGCGWWTSSKTTATEQAAADIARCALDAYAEDPQITPEKLAARCAITVITDAGKILVAVKHVPKPISAGPCPSSSASK